MDDLHQIQEYYAVAAPAYGRKLLDNLIKRPQQLLSFPESGRLVLEFKDGITRELICGAYRIIYRVRSPTPLVVDISRVHPSAKPLAPLP